MLKTAEVYHFCTYPTRGGAGIAADRLVRGLRNDGVQSKLVGLNPEHDSPYIEGIAYSNNILSNVRRRIRNWQLGRIPVGYEGMSSSGAVFFSDRSPNGRALCEFFQKASLLHFHWMCDLIDYGDVLEQIPRGVPLVWTLHDMGVFTGGCSYSLNCSRYEETCGECPQLESDAAKKETSRSLKRKVDAVRKVRDNLTIVCPSNWMADKARSSSMLNGIRCEVIRNGFDLDVFNPSRRVEGRQLIGCADQETVILFVAASFDNPLKGMDTLLTAMESMDSSTVRICYLGDKGEGHFPQHWQWLGKVQDEQKLAKLYAGSDLLVVPSNADNYPNVICEALGSGVPVIGSDIGGIPELVRNGETGFLFERGRSDELGSRIQQLITDYPGGRNKWSRSCRAFAERTFELRHITEQHLDLYRSLGWKQ